MMCMASGFSWIEPPGGIGTPNETLVLVEDGFVLTDRDRFAQLLLPLVTALDALHPPG